MRYVYFIFSIFFLTANTSFAEIIEDKMLVDEIFQYGRIHHKIDGDKNLYTIYHISWEKLYVCRVLNTIRKEPTVTCMDQHF